LNICPSDSPNLRRGGGAPSLFPDVDLVQYMR
jgi:hypothetical protein